MDRHVWTDERIDDMVDRLDKNAELLRVEMQDLRREMREGFASLRTELLDLNRAMATGFMSVHRQMVQAALVLSGVLVAALVTILATTL